MLFVLHIYTSCPVNKLLLPLLLHGVNTLITLEFSLGPADREFIRKYDNAIPIHICVSLVIIPDVRFGYMIITYSSQIIFLPLTTND